MKLHTVLNEVKKPLGAGIFLAVLFALAFAMTQNIAAQTAAGSVSGEITDQLGALVPDATVILTDTATRIAQSSKTNGKGIFEYPEVQAGSYELQVEKAGFRTTNVTFTVEVAQEQRIDVKLLIGSADRVIEVKTDPVTIERSTSGLGTIISDAEVRDLPMNGRNVFALAGLAPGITTGADFGVGLSTNRGAAIAAGANNFRANGGVAGLNEILLDGIPITVCCQGQPAVIADADIVSQFKVQTNVPPANFGRSSGGALNIITKSGGSRVSGDLYEYMRNDIFDAAPFFAKAAGTPPIPGRNNYRLPLVYNQFGATLGGPLWIPHMLDRDKTFFFFGFEGVQASRKNYAITTVPTPLQRTGDLSEGPDIAYDPFNTVVVGGKTQRAPLPNNSSGKCCIVPLNRQNSIAQRLMTLYPLPNLPTPQTPSVVNNYGYISGQFDTDWQYSARIDRVVNSRYNFTLRGTYTTNEDLRGSILDSYTEPNSTSQYLHAAVFEWDNTFVLTPSTLLNAHYGFAWQTNLTNGGSLNYNAADYGFPGNFTSLQQTPGLPTTAVSGYVTTGNETATQLRHYTHIFGASLTTQRGRHTILTGWDGRIFLNNVFPQSSGAGSFGYSTTFTVGPLGTSKPVTGQAQFDGLASFLLGLPTSGSISVTSKFSYVQPYNAFYVQDDWRVLSNLTLNLGLRYDLENGPRERNNKLSQLNPAGSNPLAQTLNLPFSGTIEFGGSGRSSRMWAMPLYEFAPRVGLAYTFNDSVVFRGGYGIFYLPTTQRLYDSGNPSFNVTTDYLASVNGGQTASGSLSNPYPTGIAQIQGAEAGPTAQTGSDISSVLYNSVPGYVQQWNFGTMTQMTRTTVLTIAYAGAHGVHLPIDLNPNDINPKYFGAIGDTAAVNQLDSTTYANPFAPYAATGALSKSTITRKQLLSAFPQYSSVSEQYVSRGSSSYNSLQASLRAKTKNLTSILAYTWSKSIGNVNNNTTSFLDTGSPDYQNSYDLGIERAVDTSDVTHRFTGSVIAVLPFGRRQHFLRSAPAWLDAVVGGWTVTTITTAQSGLPINITDTGQPTLAGSRPMRVPGIAAKTTGPVTTRLGGNNSASGSGYLNAAAFAYPLAFQLGDVPRLSADLRSPGALNADVSGLKTFALHNTWKLQLRGEAFNVFNHTQFAAPSAVYGSATFGTITAQKNLPRQIQIAMKLFW